jgi:F420H(2)-dependent quinone reductase
MTPPSGRDALRTLNRYVVPAVKAGVATPLPVGLGLVVLETVGRKSGLVRSVPVVAFRAGDRVTISTVRSDSMWLANLEANPNAGLWRGGKRRDVVAKVQRGPINVVTLDTA